MLSTSHLLPAQTRLPGASLYWFRGYGQFTLSEKHTLHFEIDERRFFNPDRQSTFFSHLHLHQSLPHHWDAAIGFSFNRNHVSPQLALNEYRPFLETSKTWIAGRSNISLRYRLDNRFIQKHENNELTEGYSFNQRHRFRVQWIQQLTSSSSSHAWLLKVSNETMLNSGDPVRVVDQVRDYAGAEYTVNSHWGIESGYLHIYLTRGSTDYQIRHVWRTTIYYRVAGKHG